MVFENDRITEWSSLYDNLDKMSSARIIAAINNEDQKIASAIRQAIPVIIRVVDELVVRFKKGGRLIYIGAGTSGRLGILDASEIPPTYGMSPDRVIGLIAGGDAAIKQSIENAEDSSSDSQKDLEALNLTENDVVIGIAASGTTPYVLGGLKYAQSLGVYTAAMTNNMNTPLQYVTNELIELVVGPEVVTGSTRMKSGTSQKMVLNMISTTLMIKIGRVKGNKMVNMQLKNKKLVQRAIGLLEEELNIKESLARELLDQYGTVQEVLNHYKA